MFRKLRFIPFCGLQREPFLHLDRDQQKLQWIRSLYHRLVDQFFCQSDEVQVHEEYRFHQQPGQILSAYHPRILDLYRKTIAKIKNLPNVDKEHM